MKEVCTPDEIKLFYMPEGRLRMTIADRISYLEVKPVWAAPLSFPRRYLGFMDTKGAEITMVDTIESLDPASRDIAEDALHKRYLTAVIESIVSAKAEFGVTYWTVMTDRGKRDFVAQSLQENAQWLTPTHLLLLDVDGNRFEIPDTTALDAKSRKRMSEIL